MLFCVCVLIALSTVFHAIKSPDHSPFSHAVLPVLFLSYWSFQLHISLYLPRPWYNPLWLTGLKAPANELSNLLLKGERKYDWPWFYLLCRVNALPVFPTCLNPLFRTHKNSGKLCRKEDTLLRLDGCAHLAEPTAHLRFVPCDCIDRVQ